MLVFNVSAHRHSLFFFSEATSITTSGYHIPTIRPSTDLGEASAAKQISLAVDMPRTRGPVTLFDLLEALQVSAHPTPITEDLNFLPPWLVSVTSWLEPPCKVERPRFKSRSGHTKDWKNGICIAD